jgi:hypothetical protein
MFRSKWKRASYLSKADSSEQYRCDKLIHLCVVKCRQYGREVMCRGVVRSPRLAPPTDKSEHGSRSSSLPCMHATHSHRGCKRLAADTLRALLLRHGAWHSAVKKQNTRSSMNENRDLGDPMERDDDGEEVEPEEHVNDEAAEDSDEASDDDDDEEMEDSDEDEDQDDGDNAIINSILGELDHSARFHEGLSFESNDIMLWIDQLTDQGMAILVAELKEMSASEASWDHLVERISVDVEHPFHDMKVAQRITTTLDCLDLASMTLFGLEEGSHDEDALHQWKPLVVDHFVKWMTTTVSITRPENMSSLRLGSLGYDPTVWDSFAARYPSIERIWLSIGEAAACYPNSTPHATALALSMRRLRQLRVLRVVVHVSGGSSILLSCICQGLLSLPQVDQFEVFVYMKDAKLCSSCARDPELALHEIGSVLAFASSLKNVSIGFNEAAKARIHDVGVLFDQLRPSGSIAKVKLSRVEISGTRQTPFHKGFLARAKNQLETKPSIVNTSIKSLVLENCSIGKAYPSAFASFTGIDDVSLIVENWRSHDAHLSWSTPESWSTLFRTHPQLKSFTVGEIDVNYAPFDEEEILAALVASLDLATSLQDVTIGANSGTQDGQTMLLPSLENLLCKCKGKLTLQHDGVNEGTTASLCAGLKVAPFLANLQLTVAGEEMTDQMVVSILQSLHKNRAIKTFHGKFVFDSPVEVGILDAVLFALLSSNSLLESFGLEVLLRERLHNVVVDDQPIDGEIPSNYTELVVAPIARALAENRFLKVLCLNGLEVMDPSAFALLSGMLKTNVTLERITFHDNVEDSEAKDAIDWLLTLNRYKRRCLVQDSNLVDQSPHPSNKTPRPTSVHDPDSLPRGAYSSVLERIATDRREAVMYHFLRRLPKALFASSGRGLKRPSPSHRRDDGGIDHLDGDGGTDGPDDGGVDGDLDGPDDGSAGSDWVSVIRME